MTSTSPSTTPATASAAASAEVRVVRAAYDALFATVQHWDAHRASDPALHAIGAALVHHEARLLDLGAFEEWLDLWHGAGLSWLPLRTDAHPADDQSFYVDDTRRRAERVAWMRDPEAWSQSPRLRTVRTVGTVEASEAAGELYVRSAFHLAEQRRSPVRQWFGHQFHRFVPDPSTTHGWRILHKVIAVPQLERSSEHPGVLL